MKKYITTPIYYTNGAPHIGHAYTTILADVFKKFEQMKGNEVFFSTGTDEHGQKNQHSCEASGLPIDTFLAQQSQLFKDLFDRMDLNYDHFIRTSCDDHKNVVRRVLQDLYDRGLIIKKSYEGLYCEGCEQFKKKTDLDENGLCPDHKKAPKVVSEENYFFRLEPHRQWLKDYIISHPDWITPANYAKEVLGMLEEPLDDLCISRPKNRVWLGIELPFDSDFVTYIWFDALINYISILKWGENADFNSYWQNSYHLLAKDILKPHCVYWPIMLKAIGTDPVKHCVVHGYWIGEGGVKMSKSLGNVVDPNEVIDIMGVEPLRFYLINNMGVTSDSPISIGLLKQGYKQLANSLGNLQMRVLKMVDKNLAGSIPADVSLTASDEELLQKIASDFTSIYKKDITLETAIELANKVMESSNALNTYFANNEPWVLVKDPAQMERFKQVVYTTLDALRLIAIALYPLMPKASESILQSMAVNQKPTAQFEAKQLSSGQITVPQPLFPFLG
jgi:methionyl-tRNA synthetase